MSNTLPFGSLTSGPEENSAPTMAVVRKIKTRAVPRSRMTVLTFCRNRLNKEMIDLSVFMREVPINLSKDVT
jgi:hypothetical protein